MIDEPEEQLIEQEVEEAVGEVRAAQSPGQPAAQWGRLSVNLAANFANFAFALLIGLWFTPYLIHNLGTASYGIIPLITQVTNYMAVATIVLNSAVARYMTISLEQGDTEEANQYFNTSLFGSVLIVLLLLIPAGLAAFYLDRLIELPAGQTTQARWLFICVATSFFLSAIQSAFAVSTFYMNRFDLRNLLGATQQVARVSVVVLLFSLIRPELYFVGLATLLSGCVGWGWSIRWWRKLTPTLHISISHFNLRA